MRLRHLGVLKYCNQENNDWLLVANNCLPRCRSLLVENEKNLLIAHHIFSVALATKIPKMAPDVKIVLEQEIIRRALRANS